MKKFFFQFGILAIVSLVALAVATGKITNLPFISPKLSSTQVILSNDTRINVEVADTADKRKLGLGGRQSLATNSGMLFTFDNPGKPQFWMKEMKFPLDLIWIRQKKIVDIIKNAPSPKPNQTDENLPLYAPNQPIDMVLEVTAGFVDSYMVKVGDNIGIESAH